MVSASLANADVWATAAVVAGFDDVGWVAKSETRGGLLVAEDGRMRRWIGPLIELTAVRPTSETGCN